MLPAMILFGGCDKNNNTPDPSPAPIQTGDSIAPLITLAGKNPDTTALQSTYNDPGYSATDNADGDITAKVAKSGTVNLNSAGTYAFAYNVSDNAGNKAVTAMRKVVVINSSRYLQGSYSYTSACNTTTTTNQTVNIFASGSVNNQVEIYPLITNNTAQNAIGFVNGNTITINKIVNGSNSFEGTGTILADKKTILLQTISISSSGTINCTATLYRP